MLENPGIGNIRNLLNSVHSSRDAVSLKSGNIVKATVVDVHDDGSALLRLFTNGIAKRTAQGDVIKANSDVPLTKGQTVYLEILGGKGNIQLRFVGETENSVEGQKQDMPTRLLGMLLRLSESGLSKSESKQLLDILRSLPQNIKNAFPALKNLENLLNDGKLMEGKSYTTSVRNLLAVEGQSNKPLAPMAGSIMKAEVVDITTKGKAVLRFIASDSTNRNIQGAIVKTQAGVPLTKGQNIFLEVLGGDNTIRMRLVSGFRNSSEVLQQIIPARFLNMLAQLSNARVEHTEFHKLFNMLKSLPQSVKAAIPEFQRLEKLMLDIKQIDGKLLKAFVETSGVAFETRLKIAALSDRGSMLQNLMAFQAEGDFKAVLMRLKDLLKDQNVMKTLTDAGFRISEVSGGIEKFIRNIEFFQLTSRIEDMFYTFLPVLWDDLKDGEFLFKKGKGRRRGSFTCDINLDFESFGKLSISVTVLSKAFYITFSTEKQEVKDLITSQKHILEQRFVSQGLPLNAITVNQKKEIVFGKTHQQGVNIKI